MNMNVYRAFPTSNDDQTKIEFQASTGNFQHSTVFHRIACKDQIISIGSSILRIVVEMLNHRIPIQKIWFDENPMINILMMRKII
jgi:hypothetical protein